jgi:hypothetical protein
MCFPKMRFEEEGGREWRGTKGYQFSILLYTRSTFSFLFFCRFLRVCYERADRLFTFIAGLFSYSVGVFGVGRYIQRGVMGGVFIYVTLHLPTLGL